MTAHIDPNPIVYTNIGPIAEGGTARYSGTLTQEDGETAVGASALEYLKLTLRDIATGKIINSRSAQDVLNLHNVTVGEDGRLTWTLTPEDNVFVRTNPPGTDGEQELHEAVFEWAWEDGAKVGRKKVFVSIEKYLGPSGPGTGSSTYSNTVTTADGDALDDAKVWATSDAAGEVVVAGPVFTAVDGSFTLRLNPGSYYLWISHESYNFDSSTQITVT